VEHSLLEPFTAADDERLPSNLDIAKGTGVLRVARGGEHASA
jgi:hypothetical protein